MKTVYLNYTIYTNKAGQFHREDGPALELINGDKEWYKDNKRHRLNGHAVEDPNGTKYWFQNGKLHRIDGPAIEYADKTKYWYLDDKLINCKTQEEFECLFPDIKFEIKRDNEIKAILKAQNIAWRQRLFPLSHDSWTFYLERFEKYLILCIEDVDLL